MTAQFDFGSDPATLGLVGTLLAAVVAIGVVLWFTFRPILRPR